jgi:hypothetical protein
LIHSCTRLFEVHYQIDWPFIPTVSRTHDGKFRSINYLQKVSYRAKQNPWTVCELSTTLSFEKARKVDDLQNAGSNFEQQQPAVSFNKQKHIIRRKKQQGARPKRDL